ncbi:hypothetical protein A2303_06590 [Candidatus Falkowbacteria bacterium RIFOXYB2_FULL_47_14]|uniref:Cohesin domain-containing protein n=1 Tax=Candidatus Falkowbacteria bacterium RIFOXYA2_FULL_47_19 TaxID=1797994 RepID=A0A1F5SJG3_9BACT|nr:MAG: hypothetical protein A2227_06245 [Candidatus Falkowbacteria bacterium RIFOXYA2_FULL_47_19]OGF35911.1 MAG: hypothetical protein A2468_01700 [Candidatus Falkowbacteria bacterium RIFOXYC2_FULL_46_15]OGF42822.1 MAG: hypothetical protein A2303_06590 [Candidatus Falkowbacteria bacterium RIFOXYB2_FULL_47_14]
MFKKITILSILLLLPVCANAAVLYLDPAQGEYGPGDSFTADIKIDVDGECVNTVEAFIGFPSDYLNIIDFLIGESILNLWVEKPDRAGLKEVNQKGELHFSGGIPGGYCGKIPGDPGESNILGRIVFQVPGMIISDIDRDSLSVDFSAASRVLLHDGLGTADVLTTRGAVYKFSGASTDPDESWREDIKSDTISPLPFVIELRSDPGIFDGRYYIIFSTTDKETGMDHFEVLEITPEELSGITDKPGLYERLFMEPKTPSAWKRAKTPYLLEDQSLLSVIRVKAVDKAGNERIEEYVPPESMRVSVSRRSPGEIVFWVSLAIAALTVIFIVIILVIKIIKKIKKSKNYEKNKP